MACLAVTPTSVSSSLRQRIQSSSPLPQPATIASSFPIYTQLLGSRARRSRGLSIVTRGGTPGTGTYIFAFVFPLSLLAVTIFTSFRISDELDRKYYEELAINQSILEAENEDEDDNNDEDEDVDVATPIEEEPARQRTRIRPKREAEVSSR